MSGQRLKSIKFKLPIIEEDMEIGGQHYHTYPQNFREAPELVISFMEGTLE